MRRSPCRWLHVVLLFGLLAAVWPAVTPVAALRSDADRAASTSMRAPSLRVKVDQRGDFILIGNTFGHECTTGTPAPLVGVVGACGTNTVDSAPDIFWRSDAPTAGQAEANTSVTAAQARSTAFLLLPAGAQVTHAYLYWSAALTAPGSDSTATLDRPGVFTEPITAAEVLTGPNNSYRSMADITALVQARGSGAYRMSGVDLPTLVNVDNANLFGAWWMVVLYRQESEPLRSLTIYDGLDGVNAGVPRDIALSGFVVPSAGADAKLGVVALDGDNTATGDSLSFNGSVLSNIQNPANNFFNSTRSRFGSAVTMNGDLPQLTGTAQSMSGIDLDVADVAPYLSAGQTSATISATTNSDVYFLATVVTAISTVKPDLSSSTKSVTDLDGGAILPGDQLEYTLSITNTGGEAGSFTVLEDVLPAGLTYEIGSLEIVSGPNTGPKSDAADSDQAEYSVATRQVTVRLGQDASGLQGGTLSAGASTTVRFRVRVNAECAGPQTISNQASIDTTGALSAAAHSFLTDGDAGQAGSQPTSFTINFRCLSVTRAGAGSGTVTSAPAGIDCGGDCAEVVLHGTQVTLTAVPDVGSTFIGWSGDCTGTGVCSITLDATKAVTAEFEIARQLCFLPLIAR